MREFLNIFVLFVCITCCGENISISSLDPARVKSKGSVISINKTASGKAIEICNKKFEEGISVAGGSDMCFMVGTAAERLKGSVAVYASSKGEMLFTVYSDSRVLWRSKSGWSGALRCNCLI